MSQIVRLSGSLTTPSTTFAAQNLARAPGKAELVWSRRDREGVPSDGDAVVVATRPASPADLAPPLARRLVGSVGQRNLAVTANTYTHVLADETELDYADLPRLHLDRT